jgi:hypothetical protein
MKDSEVGWLLLLAAAGFVLLKSDPLGAVRVAPGGAGAWPGSTPINPAGGYPSGYPTGRPAMGTGNTNPLTALIGSVTGTLTSIFGRPAAPVHAGGGALTQVTPSTTELPPNYIEVPPPPPNYQFEIPAGGWSSLPQYAPSPFPQYEWSTPTMPVGYHFEVPAGGWESLPQY